MFHFPYSEVLFLFYAEPNDESGANVDASVSITCTFSRRIFCLFVTGHVHTENTKPHVQHPLRA